MTTLMTMRQENLAQFMQVDILVQQIYTMYLRSKLFQIITQEKLSVSTILGI